MLEVLKEVGVEIPQPAADVYAIIPDASALPQVFKTVQQLRAAGVAVQMHAAAGGSAEGMGSIDGYYRYGRDDAMLDFLGLSEHDIVVDGHPFRRRPGSQDGVGEAGGAVERARGQRRAREREGGGQHVKRRDARVHAKDIPEILT